MLVRDKAGLDAAILGPAAMERAVRARMSACGLRDTREYLARASSSGAELQELIEALVVAETWFFRDRKAFAALAGFARNVALPAHPRRAMRLLSLPCSTGEEPYSMAIALLEAGVPAERFAVDAMDISERALRLALRGIYGRNSFRGAGLEFRERFFEPVASGHRIGDAVRAQVRFRQANFLDLDPAAAGGPYDAIFCRNVLIYFDAAARERAVGVLNRLLAKDGLLFVAPSESALLLRHDMPRSDAAHAFGRRGAGARPMISTKPRAVARRKPRAADMPAPIPAAPVRPALASPASAAPLSSLETIEALADGGRSAEAIALCEAHVRTYGPSARAFYLLGLLHDARDAAADAADAYRRALYLDPQHTEAMVHLALSMERSGNIDAARQLRRRARRLPARDGN